jgi:hypothetical protein
MVLNNVKHLPSRHSFTIDVCIFTWHHYAPLPKNAKISKDHEKNTKNWKRMKKDEKT